MQQNEGRCGQMSQWSMYLFFKTTRSDGSIICYASKDARQRNLHLKISPHRGRGHGNPGIISKPGYVVGGNLDSVRQMTDDHVGFSQLSIFLSFN